MVTSSPTRRLPLRFAVQPVCSSLPPFPFYWMCYHDNRCNIYFKAPKSLTLRHLYTGAGGCAGARKKSSVRHPGISATQ